ncbi:hypothetical protein HU200_033895 [Digitaria exilis]|uniref:Uncharacterized protein n=1 Tax=Digitaria exilis TaxID=1010633 RepID=A0A835BQZ0_9POAL|nr:hypothetical protein HU200_033895 [Digitaria exilis]
MPHAGFPASWASPAQESGGQASWAPPSQQPGVPAASPANGSGQSQSQSQPPALGKTFEEFLMDAGVLNEWAGDDLVLQGLMQDLQAALGQVVPDAPMAAAASLGGVGPPPPPPRPGAGAVGPFSGPSRYQVGLYMAQAQEEEDEEEPVGSAGRDPADARARRIRRMGKRREARARHGY